MIAVCGGNTGSGISNKFFTLAFKTNKNNKVDASSQAQAPVITELPPMIKPREELALVLGPDGKLYAIGGYNPSE